VNAGVLLGQRQTILALDAQPADRLTEASIVERFVASQGDPVWFRRCLDASFYLNSLFATGHKRDLHCRC
jgi:hypothetical protein